MDNSSYAERYRPGGFHSIHSHEMQLSAQQQEQALSGAASFQGFAASTSGHNSPERLIPKQHTLAFANGKSSPERADGLHHSISSKHSGSSYSPLKTTSSHIRSNLDSYNADGEVDVTQVLGLQAPHHLQLDGGRLAEQNLAKGAALARIMDTSSGITNRNLKSAGPSSPRTAGSPPSSPKGVALAQGVVGNSMRHLQPWQMPQAHTVPGQQSFASNSSKPSVLHSAPHAVINKPSPLLSSPSEKQHQWQHQPTDGPAVSQPAAGPLPPNATAAVLQQETVGPKNPPAATSSQQPLLNSAVLEVIGQGLQHNKSPAFSLGKAARVRAMPSSTGGRDSSSPDGPTSSGRAATVPTPEEQAKLSARFAAAVIECQFQHAQQLQMKQQQPTPAMIQQSAKMQAPRKGVGGLFACCFRGSKADSDEEFAQKIAGSAARSASATPEQAGAAVDIVLAKATELRSSEVWGLAGDKAESQGNVQPAAQHAVDNGDHQTAAAHESMQTEQPQQQAFGFHSGPATGPFVDLGAESLPPDSSSIGGCDSRVASMGGAGGAAYNPPGAYNLPADMSAAPNRVGSRGFLRSLSSGLSSSRRFNRQGSKWRHTADACQDKERQDSKIQTAPALFVCPPHDSDTPSSTQDAQLPSSMAPVSKAITTADITASAAAAAAAAVAGWAASDADTAAILAGALTGAQAAAEKEWSARVTADSVAGGQLAKKKVLFSAPVAASIGARKSIGRTQSTDSAGPKIVPWANLQQQLEAKQTQHLNILQKQKEAEKKLVQQQQQLTQQLESLRQLRSRTPSPVGKGGKSSSPRISPRKDSPALHSTGSITALPPHAAGTSRGGKNPVAQGRVSGSKASPVRSKAAEMNVPSTVVALEDLLSSANNHQRGSNKVFSPEASKVGERAGMPQKAAGSAAGSDGGDQLRAAAETLLRSLDGKQSGIAADAVRVLLGDALADAPAAPGGRAAGSSSSGSSSSTSKSPSKTYRASNASSTKASPKKPFILHIPGVSIAPVVPQEQSNAFKFTNTSITRQQAATSTFKLLRGLISLSFKRKKPGPQQSGPKTVRAWYRPVSLSPKSPVVKYSSFKIAASLLSPQLISPNSARSITLVSPSTSFNSRRIKAGMISEVGAKSAERGCEALDAIEGANEVATTIAEARDQVEAACGAICRVPSCSSEDSIPSQHSFAVSGEDFAAAADEETAGTAAADYTQADSPSRHITQSSLSNMLPSAAASKPQSSGTGGSRPVQPELQPPSKAQAGTLGTVSLKKQHSTAASSSGTGRVHPRRATADGVGAGSRAQRQQEQRGKAVPPASPRLQKGSYAAASNRRATTSDAPSKAGQLHMMSRNSYLQMLKHGSVHGSDSSSEGQSTVGANAGGRKVGIAASPAVAQAPAAAPGPIDPGHVTYMCQADGLQQQQERQLPQTPKMSPKASPKQSPKQSPKHLTAAAAAAGHNPPGYQRQRTGSLHSPSSSLGCPSPGAAAEAAARDAATEIAARALHSVMNRAVGMPSPDGEAGTAVAGDRFETFAAFLEQRPALLSSIGDSYSLEGSAAGSVGAFSGSGVSQTPTAAAARAAAQAAVQAVVAAADARAAEAKAAAEAAMLRGASSADQSDEPSYNDGIDGYYDELRQPQLGIQVPQWDQAMTEEQHQLASEHEQQQQLLQKRLIEQQMAVLQQQLQQLQQH